MPKLNSEIILYNLRDVREQIDEIIRLAETEDLDKINFQVKMEHAYHHLNCAWNVRQIGTKRYAKCTKKDFNEWSKFPRDLDEYEI